MAITNPRSLSIGDLARRTGVNIETIRYYERIGVIPRAGRSAGRQRAFDDAALRSLAFVRRCRELGFSLDEIRALLALVTGAGFTCEEVRALTERHLAGVRGKLTSLRRMERVLARMVAECQGGAIPECPIVDALYHQRSP